MHPSLVASIKSVALLGLAFGVWVGATLASESASLLTPAQVRTEAELLAAARANIERIRKGEASIVVTDAAGRPLPKVHIALDQTRHEFLFGNLSEEVFCLEPDEAEIFRQRFVRLFNYTELTVKWTPYERVQGRPDWQSLQRKLDWCREHGIVPKGHAIGWTNLSGTPPWLLRLPPEQATDLYRAHVLNLVGGFKDQIRMWDVVNEPVTTVPWEYALRDAGRDAAGIATGSRYAVAQIPFEAFVPWVENSYRWAQQADPTGDFHINEFNIVSKRDVREKYHRLIAELLKRGVRVTGIGIQAHEPRDMWFPPGEVVASFDRFNDLGLPLHITEFIPQSSGQPITGGWRQGVWTEEEQAAFAEQFYTLAFGHPAMASIHWWGLSDRMIWLPGGGLLDRDLNPKPVYRRLDRLINETWMTKGRVVVADARGTAAFRGFYGRYEIVVTGPDGQTRRYERTLSKTGDNRWELVW